MKKSKSLKGGIAGAAALAAVFAVACSVAAGAFAPSATAFANSGPMYEYGVTASGVIVCGEGSALAVEREKLTFDIRELPESIYGGERHEYASSVTAEYAFVNTSDNTVVTEMAFPVGSRPSYANGDEHDDYKFFDAPTITVDGEPVDCEVRHTYYKFTSFDESAAGLLDGWFEDGFYNPDLPVTVYRVMLDKESDELISSGKYDGVVACGSAVCGDGARFLCPDFDSFNGEMRFYFYSNPNYRFDYNFYVLGDSSQFSCKWRVQQTYNDRPLDLNVQVEETGTTTLSELILSGRDGDSEISERDYYNAYAANLLSGGDSVGATGYAGGCAYPLSESDFCAWYTYRTEAVPHGKFINTVTAPMYPTIKYAYKPNVYEYVYYISPAAKWKSFGGLDVEINTPYYMIASFAEFGRTDGSGRFTASFTGLPGGEIVFSLCTEQEPLSKFFGFWVDGEKTGRVVRTVMWVWLGAAAAALIIFATVMLVKKRKKIALDKGVGAYYNLGERTEEINGMFCRNCGKQIDDSAVFCPHCGVQTFGTPNNDQPLKGQAQYTGNQQQQQQPQWQQGNAQGQPVNTQPLNDYYYSHQQPANKSTNGFGIAGFVLGLISLYLGMYFCIAPIVGLVLSIVGVANMKKYKSCNGLAIAGLVLSAITLAFWGIILLIAIAMVF